MKNIIFYSDSAKGHLIPTLYVADQLRNGGHNVSYIGQQSVTDEVKKFGFKYYTVFKDDDCCENKNSLKYILDGEMDKIISEADPEYIVSTPFNVLETLLLYYKYKIKVLFIWSHFPEVKYVPNISRFTSFVKNKIGDSFLAQSTGENFFIFTNYLNTMGYKIRSLDDIMEPLLHVGHLITMSKALLGHLDPQFDNEIFLGPCIFNKSLFEKQSNSSKNEIQLPSIVMNDRKIIYCSMGTGSSEVNYTNKATDILTRLIKCAASESLQDYTFIIACGNSLSYLKKLKYSTNVHLYDWVSQIDILKYTSLAIVHGGMGTIKECIMANVPMVLTPICRDQILNTKLVVDKNLGVELNTCDGFEEKLVNIIDYVLYNEAIKNSIYKMKASFNEDTQQRKALDYINNL